MATTTYYSLTLPNTLSSDWERTLNRVLSLLTEILVSNQKPADVTLRWGDVAAGRFIECNALGVKVIGGLDSGNVATKNFVFEGGAEFPADPVAGRAFWRPDLLTLYLYNGVAWQAIAGDGVVGTPVTLEDYGTARGNLLVLNNAGALVPLNPTGKDGHVLVVDLAQASGWSFKTQTQVLSGGYAKGAIRAGTGADTSTILEIPGASPGNRFLVIDTGEATGLKWVTPILALGKVFTARGELLAGSGSATGALVSPPDADEVLIGDPAEPGGVRWAPQSELGSIPGATTNHIANLIAAGLYG